LLLLAETPPTRRVVLVNGIEAWVETSAGRFAISSQHYAPDITFPGGADAITAFDHDPWPTWRFTLPDGAVITQEIATARDACTTVLRWRRAPGRGSCRLTVRPLLSGRDYHALHRENAGFRFDGLVRGGNVAWRPYEPLPAVSALTSGAYAAAPEWYRNFLYAAEQDRGLDCIEDLASPGLFTFDLDAAPAAMLLRGGDDIWARAAPLADDLLATERTRREKHSPLRRAAACYTVDRRTGQTIIAGFPWFTDWGRDTFIAMRGLVIGAGRLDAATAILAAWAGVVSEGMLPNRFPDDGATPEYNAVDASLWFVIAVHDYREAAGETARCDGALEDAVQAILRGYAAGTRFGIAADTDGLLRAGVPGVQLTWMDAKIGDRVVTPRIGKPVEVQALWINALTIGAQRVPHWASLAAQARASFLKRFPNPAGGLYDVVDADHVPGRTDAKLRPNQILAVGGLPYPLLDGAAARNVVDLVEARLATPLGLRSLDPADPDYRGHYQGGQVARDEAYHQGVVWPWLVGPFVEAWLRVRGDSAAARAEARERFIAPLLAHLDSAGLGHVSEIADGDAPHAPGGCPFQAWSLGELMRAQAMVEAS
jgi:predicted glycogen debranching enzyme